MRLKYLGNRTRQYQGHDGHGGMLDLKRGDECSVSETVGGKLLQHYRGDFEKLEESKEHAPDKNKMLPKGSKFKSK